MEVDAEKNKDVGNILLVTVVFTGGNKSSHAYVYITIRFSKVSIV